MEGNGHLEGRRFKRRQFPRGWVVVFRVFFLGAPNKIDEQVSIIILLIFVSKQKLLFLKEGAILRFFFWREGATLHRIISWLLGCEGISLRASSLGARAPNLEVKLEVGNYNDKTLSFLEGIHAIIYGRTGHENSKRLKFVFIINTSFYSKGLLKT